MESHIQQSLMQSSTNTTLEAMKRASKMEKAEMATMQDVSADALLKSVTEPRHPFPKMRTKRKSLKDRANKVKKSQLSTQKKKSVLPVSKVKDTAEKFAKKNPELKAKMLMALFNAMKKGMGRDQILKKVSQFYEDVSLADEALEFLEETASGELEEEARAARAELSDKYGREISAGKNIAKQARAFSQKGLGTPSGLRDLYRELTGNPRSSAALFSELSDKFSYKDLKNVIKFFFHSLGTDLKSKGPSIPRGLLHRLMTQTRSLQAIMGVFHFFKGRMRLIQRMFTRNKIPLPAKMNFEQLTKLFMSLAKERYPTPDKALDMARKLGIDDWLIAKIIVLSQVRDAVREVAINQIYKSLQHRDDLYNALIEALEELEDELEELEERMALDDEEEEEKEGEEEEEKE